MHWAFKVNEALLMLNYPENENRVAALLESLDSDVLIDYGDGLTNLERVYNELINMGEQEVATSLVYPALKKEKENI